MTPAPQQPRRARACLAAALALLVLCATGVPARAETAAANVTKEQAARFAEQARAWQRQLTDQVMPYWYDNAIDRDAGGYILRDSITPEKLVVTQARLVWGFAHAHRLGLSTPERDYLAAAAQGYQFLLDHFLDREHGGYVWATNRPGQVIDERKLLYGQAFVIYALVEYHRASGDPAALQQATDLYRTVQARCRDLEHGGWGEHFERDWRPVTDNAIRVGVGIAGTRSGDALLHWMEALTELYAATRTVEVASDQVPELEAALAEALDLAATHFYPAQAGQAYPYRDPDWQRPIGARFKEISYGRNVEFAWLMIGAERALGRPPSWERFDALMQHALAYAYDHERGGLYQLGFDDRPAALTDKVWWVQAELLAALTESLSHRPSDDYAVALDQLLTFLVAYQIDPRDGIWLDTVAANGALRRPAKAHSWKANYHDLRAMAKFIAAFGPGPESEPAAPR